MSADPILPDDVIERAIEHMNEDHAHNLLDYAQVLADLSWAEGVEMSELDFEGFELIVHGEGRVQQVRIDFDKPLTDASELRPALVELANRARE
ncbi:MAG: DUF2470 domain-containing protein [Chloroflexota bacterium]